MRQIDIERLLQWAYRDELPKVAPSGDVIDEQWLAKIAKPLDPRSSMGIVDEVGQLGGLVQGNDVRNRYGLVPSALCWSSEPHPDALIVGDAVLAMNAYQLCVPEDWSPLTDMGDLGSDGLGVVARALGALTVIGRDGRTRALKGRISDLLVRQAGFGRGPDWHGDFPEVKYEKHSNGMHKWFRRELVDWLEEKVEREVEGYDMKRKRPWPDAYRKTYLDPDPLECAIARGEYELWIGAMALLAEDLAGKLSEHVVLASLRPSRPWETGDLPARRILPSLRVMPVPALPERRKRKLKKAA